MSSLWSLLKKKDDIHYDSTRFSADSVTTLISGLRKWPPVLINATQLVADIQSCRCSSSPATDLTPSFQSLWIEYSNVYQNGTFGREAVSTSRWDMEQCRPHIPVPEKAAHCLSCFLWIEQDGAVGLVGAATLMIDSAGEIIFDGSAPNWDLSDKGCNRQFAIALEALTTMNTRGTRIDPPLEKHVQVVKPDRAPCSVWRTIHLPKMPSVPLGAETSDTMLDRREHWVRAHRRDYRHGGGMFGRVKALVWVPEFQRGNPELGTVKQSYAVAQR